jgi:hypothetical protein
MCLIKQSTHTNTHTHTHTTHLRAVERRHSGICCPDRAAWKSGIHLTGHALPCALCVSHVCSICVTIWNMNRVTKRINTHTHTHTHTDRLYIPTCGGAVGLPLHRGSTSGIPQTRHTPECSIARPPSQRHINTHQHVHTSTQEHSHTHTMDASRARNSGIFCSGHASMGSGVNSPASENPM